MAAGFEQVREAFAENFAKRGELGAACAVFRHGEPVVDLWGGLRDAGRGLPWEPDTMVLVFSTTKGLSAMAMAVAHSRGLFALDEPVAAYWPEFAQAGKDGVSVRQLLAHQAGVCALDGPVTLRTVADTGALAAVLAAQRPAWVPGERHGYHTLSLGFYEGELLRRVDPAHRTLGRFFRDEVAGPLGLDFHIGLPEDVPEERLAVLEPFGVLHVLLDLDRQSWRTVLAALMPWSLTARSFRNPRIGPADLRGILRRVEVPAAGGWGVVRDIARAYGEMATGGAALGISQGTMTELRVPAPEPALGPFDVVLRARTRYSFGYLKPSPDFRFGTNDAAFGTMGAGGSFAFADPDAGIGFAYAMNRMGFHLWSDPRERSLREAVYRCL